MRILVWLYVGVYALTWTLLAVVESAAVDPEERDPLWERVVDGTLVLIGFVGMLLYQGAVDLPSMQSFWRIVVPVLAIAHLALSLRSAADLFAARGSRRAEGLKAIWGGAAIAAFLVIPSLCLNALYAYR